MNQGDFREEVTFLWGLKDELEEAVTIAVFPAGPGSGASKITGGSRGPFLLL